VLSLIVVFSVGCASAGSNARLSSMIDVELETNTLKREEHIKLGRFSLSVVRGLARLAGEDFDDDESGIVKSLRSVEISTYSIEPPLVEGQDFPIGQVEKSLSTRGWTRVVTSHEDGGEVMLLTRAGHNGKIDGIFVLSADRNEVEMVQIEGPLDEAITDAIAEDSDFVKGLFGS